MRVFSHLCAPRASPRTCVRMPAHRLFLVCAWAHTPVSRSRGNAHKRALNNTTHALHVMEHISHLPAHTPSCLCTPSIPHLAPVRTHPGTHSCTRALNLPPPALRGAHKDTHALGCAHTCTFIHWGCSRAPHSCRPCVHSASSVEQPHCPPAPLRVWHPHGSLAGARQTPPHARGVGRRAVPPHWCQRRCPHNAATASDRGSGSERIGCECLTDGGDGRALGARWHSPGQLPVHPTSAERIN